MSAAIQELVITRVSSAITWRKRRMALSPGDVANQRAARELTRLLAHLSKLPEDHPVFTPPRERDPSVITRVEDKQLEAYGTKGAEDPATFVHQLAKRIRTDHSA